MTANTLVKQNDNTKWPIREANIKGPKKKLKHQWVAQFELIDSITILEYFGHFAKALIKQNVKIK